MRIIPAIDLRDGNCVRLFKGDFGKTTHYSSDPVAIADRFSKLDVSELHIVDLDGARTGEQSNREIVRTIASESGLTVQLGGGIRSREDVDAWLAAGVSRCVVGSIAIRQPATVLEWLSEFGDDAIVLALDVNIANDGTPVLTTHGWTEDSGVSLWHWIEEFGVRNARHVLCTDVARDGAMAGPNFELYTEFLGRYPEIRLQASGGVRDHADLARLADIGVPAAITGRALLDGNITEQEVASFRQNA